MLKRSLVCVFTLMFFMVAYGGAEEISAGKSDLGKEVKELKKENEQLRSELDKINAKVDEILDLNTGVEGIDPYTYMSLMDDPAQSGFIRKGSLTGVTDKLLNVNLWLGASFNQIENDSFANNLGANDVDTFAAPFARLHLTGQAFKELYFTGSFHEGSEP